MTGYSAAKADETTRSQGTNREARGAKRAALEAPTSLQGLQVHHQGVDIGGRKRRESFIGGLRVALCFAAMTLALTIHSRSSSALYFVATPSSNSFALPLPATEWQSEHFWAARRPADPSQRGPQNTGRNPARPTTIPPRQSVAS